MMLSMGHENCLCVLWRRKKDDEDNERWWRKSFLNLFRWPNCKMLGAFSVFPFKKVFSTRSKWHLIFGGLMLFGSHAITLKSREFVHYKVQDIMNPEGRNLCDDFLLPWRPAGLNLKLVRWRKRDVISRSSDNAGKWRRSLLCILDWRCSPNGPF